MFRAKDLSFILVFSLNGLAASAQPAQPLLGTDPAKANLAARVNDCREKLKLITDETSVAYIKQEAKCEILEYRMDPSCKDETKTAHESLAKFVENCGGAGFENLTECLKRARANESNCAALALQGRRTSSSGSGTMTEINRMLTDFQSDKGRSRAGGANSCIKYSTTDYTKMKAEYEKNIAAIDADIVKAQSTLADRKKTLNDQIARLADRKSEAQRKSQENSDKASQAASQEAMNVMNQAQRFEADKAKASVELYEPKMKETQAYADEKVALKPFSDIRGLCIRELREKMVKDAALYRNSSDQFTASSLAKNARDQAYWECVETFQTQVRAIKRSHQQARQGYRDQVRLIEQRIAEIEKAKQAAQRAQADTTHRATESNKRMDEYLQQQLAAMKTETANTEAALKKLDEDHAKQMANLDKRTAELHGDIQQLGAVPVGDKKLSDAKAAHIAFVAAYNAIEKRADCKIPIAGIKQTVKDHSIPLTSGNLDDNQREAGFDRPVHVNDPEVVSQGGREDAI